MNRRVVIDCFPEAAARWRDHYAVVAIDVVRATTTAITAAATGRRCFPVASLDEAFELAATLDNPLLVGELAGVMPEGFDINNSPAVLAARTDVGRPAILLSSTGTRLCKEADKGEAAFLACLRNHSAVARYLGREFPRVALIGAGTRDEFREEDQMCCAWIARSLMKAGYAAQDLQTAEIVERWRDARPDAWVGGKSAGYLRRSGQLADLDFVLAHIDDLTGVYALRDGQVVAAPRAGAQPPQELRYA
jgi:2-phosphosulfolactate phosphatase